MLYDASKKIVCHASGDRCHGCAHYRGEADTCEFAPAADLLARVRAATPDQQGDMIRLVLGRARRQGWISRGVHDRARRQCDAEAYESAALALLPDDPTNEITGKYDWQLESTNGGLTISARVGPEETRSFADAPALALLAAILTARENGDG